MKNIILFEEQGFCFGVSRSIEIVKNILSDVATPRPIYLLGSLVHNKRVNDFFKLKGVNVLNDGSRYDMLDQIEYGTVIITAHGASEKVIAKACEKGLNIVDATCPYVTKTVENIKNKINEGYQLAYIGKKNHPETETIMDDIPNAIIIEENNELPKLTKEKYILAHQTTLSEYDVKHTLDRVLEKYKNVELLKQICMFPEKRQKEIREYIFPKTNNLAIVVGDKKSNNSTKLKELLLRKRMGDVVMLNSLGELEKINLDEYENIFIASGTSTPIGLVKNIYNKIIGVKNE